MHRTILALAISLLTTPSAVLAANGQLTVDLNSVEPAENRCRLNFVIENKFDRAVETLKLDLVLFGTDGGITRRLITEMGPLRPMKTIVRTFLVDAECRSTGAILVNDVTACAPEAPVACLDGLGLSSRVKEIRLYK